VSQKTIGKSAIAPDRCVEADTPATIETIINRNSILLLLIPTRRKMISAKHKKTKLSGRTDNKNPKQHVRNIRLPRMAWRRLMEKSKARLLNINFQLIKR
jgi:hypothetical protein